MRIATCHFVCVGNDSVIIMKNFPELYLEFCEYAKTEASISTADAESEGADVLKHIKNGLHDPKLINAFVNNVINWGGKTRGLVRMQVYPKKNKSGQESEQYQAKNKIKVAKIVANSAKFLLCNNLKSAINNIALIKTNSVKGLDMSYGSKILRMLLPEDAGAYDKILRNNLSYPFNAKGYVEFCSACKDVANELKKLGIKSPHDEIDASNSRKNGEWYVADVEAVIYHYCRHYKKI